ncbi:MAG: cytochrome c biogenesis protein CcdA [Oscillospiraceae bacterium]|nr:cytochrome c biogenesis protein CcdA [Oscillospiraceae bacterium]
MNAISIITAFAAGILSFLSPCVLPLIPGYISYITGTSIKEEDTSKKMLKKALLFVLGFSIVFILLGATGATISRLFFEYKPIFNKVAGIILVILGISITGILEIKWFSNLNSKIDMTKLKGKSFLVGVAFGLGFTPCAGPILAGILMYASNLQTIGMGILMLAVYSLGLGIPFILTAVSINKAVRVMNKIKKYYKAISIISGILVIAIGILIFTDSVVILNRFFI